VGTRELTDLKEKGGRWILGLSKPMTKVRNVGVSTMTRVMLTDKRMNLGSSRNGFTIIIELLVAWGASKRPIPGSLEIKSSFSCQTTMNGLTRFVC
jgi:hypothetical protein